jgi:hypothetical protein
VSPSPKAPSDAPQYRRTRPDPASHAPLRDQVPGIMIPRSAPGVLGSLQLLLIRNTAECSCVTSESNCKACCNWDSEESPPLGIKRGFRAAEGVLIPNEQEHHPKKT